LYAAGVDYALAKSTKVYVAYAYTDNEAAAKKRMTGGGHGAKVTPLAGNDPAGIAVGVIHDF